MEDAVFLCYAMDKDRNMNNHMEFHSIFNEVGQRSFTPCSPQVHHRFTPGSPQVHPRFTPG